MKGCITMDTHPKHKFIFLLGAFLSIAFFIFTLLRFEELKSLPPKAITNESIRDLNPEVNSLYKASFDTLSYTGIDYFEDGAKIGGYYYVTEKNDVSAAGRYLFILVKSKNTPAEIIDYQANVITYTDKERLSQITGILSANTGISENEFSLMSRNYILSEVDFPYLHLIGTGLLLLASSILALIFFIHFAKK